MANAQLQQEIAYEAGYEAAVREIRQRKRKRQQRELLRKYKARKRMRAFWKYKAAGVTLLAFTIFAAWLSEWDLTIAVLTVPMAVYLFGRKDKTENDMEEWLR